MLSHYTEEGKKKKETNEDGIKRYGNIFFNIYVYLYECDCKHGINSKLTQSHWINLMLNLTLILLKYMSCPTLDMQCTSAFSRYL